MLCVRRCVCNVILLAAIVGGLTGCPPQYVDSPVELAVSPDRLDYGNDIVTRQISVTKNATALEMAPLTVTSLAPWILPQSCTDGNAGCISQGPYDPITISVRVDRSRMSLGANSGAIRIESPGAVAKTVDVFANAILVPDFRANNRSPQPGEVVQFSDLTESSDGPILLREWDFDDGTKSTVASPTHIFTQERAYKISLTVHTANRTETAVRENYILVGGEGPLADFTATPLTLFQGETVKFSDQSSSGLGQIKSWAWDFGDGGTSASTNPYHTYAAPGQYTVSLTVANEFGSNTRIRQNFIFVQSKVPPVASFSHGSPYVNQYIQFTDTSLAGSKPITGRRWDFGDPGGINNISTQLSPKYMYKQPGTYHVSLVVTTNHGTSTAERDIEVVYSPLNADFKVSRGRAIVGDLLVFTDTSLSGSLPITGRTWNFGDGATSTDLKPTHAYAVPGTYSVSLTVTNGVDTSTTTKSALVSIFERRPLDDFMRQPDLNYQYTLKRTITNYGVTGYILHLTSQQWRDATEVDKPLWKHWLTIIVPENITNTTALLMVSGGNNSSAQTGDGAPSTIDPVLAQVAKDVGSVMVVLNQTPSEPLLFADEFDPRYMNGGRTEDEIIAYTYDKFFQTGDPKWPLLLPMVKGVVRAMDAVQDFLKKRPTPITVDDFVVTGASKRGWTTWLTGAADHRVRAIAPIVIDVLNMDVQMEHHRSSYGFYSEAIIDYVDLFIFEHFNSTEGQDLLKIVDPYEYRERLIMPKLIINSTGDEFFLPDSLQFYLHDLLGLYHVTYAPNTNHSMGGYQNVVAALVPWYRGVVEQRSLPVLSWTAEDTRIVANTETVPEEVLLWTATSPNRDFRFNTELQPFPPVWTSKVLAPSGINRYIAQPNRSATAWTAFFIQFKYASGMIANGQPAPYVVSTECRVAPPTSPVAPKVNFYSNKQRAQINDPIVFTDLTAIGTSNISMWEWTFGDGSTSSLRDPVHAYTKSGTYSVTLLARSLAGEDSFTRANYIVIATPTGTRIVPDVVGMTQSEASQAIIDAGFTVGSVTLVTSPEPVNIVISQAPSAGTEALVGTPIDVSVSLGSGTGEILVPNLFNMTQAQAIAAIEAANLTVGLITEDSSTTVLAGRVMDQSPAADTPVSAGTQISFVVSLGTIIAPRIVPNLVGLTEAQARTAIANAKLTVGTVTALASTFIPAGSVMSQSPAPGSTVVEGSSVNIVISLGGQYTALDDYLGTRTFPPEYTPAGAFDLSDADAYVLDLKSQEWLTTAEVNRPEWRHWLSVVVPRQLQSTTALLVVAGGSYQRPDNKPDWYSNSDSEMAYLKQIALTTKSVVALLPQVPCEPLAFADENVGVVDPEDIQWRTEDEIIAYSYDKFLNTGDAKWPALFPMVMSAVRAMDAIQDFYQTSFVEDFVVTGASKRGWTTWLTGATDTRVRAIAPMVIDVLNMDVQMDHHYKAYNGITGSDSHIYQGYSDSVHDYVDMNIFARFNTTRGQELLHLVDPYEYRTRLYMPKLILNASGDQFFLPDSSQWYINDMPGETALRYFPNADHGLEVECCAAGNMSDSTKWRLGTGWSIGVGDERLVHAAGFVLAAYQTPSNQLVPLEEFAVYTVAFTLSGVTGGHVQVALGTEVDPTLYGQDGRYTTSIQAKGPALDIIFSPSLLFEGAIEDVSVSYSPVVYSIATFFQAQLMGGKSPRYPWRFEDDGTIRVKPVTSVQSARLWQASNHYERDFRIETLGPVWTNTPIVRDNFGEYVGEVTQPVSGWTAFFVELQYQSPIPQVPYIFTTPVRVLPDLPGQPYPQPIYRGDKVPILEFSMPEMIFAVGETSKSVDFINIGDRGLYWEIDPDSVPIWMNLPPLYGEILPGARHTINVDIDRSLIFAGFPSEVELTITTNGVPSSTVFLVIVDSVLDISIVYGNVDVPGDHITGQVLIQNTGLNKVNWAVDQVGLPRWLKIMEPSAGTVLAGHTATINIRIDRTIQLPSPTWFQYDLPIKILVPSIFDPDVSVVKETGYSTIRMFVPEPALAYAPTAGFDFGASLTSFEFVFSSSTLCDMYWALSPPDPPEEDDDPPTSYISVAPPALSGLIYTSNGGLTPQEAGATTNDVLHGQEYKSLTFTLDRSALPVGYYHEIWTLSWASRTGLESGELELHFYYAESYPPQYP